MKYITYLFNTSTLFSLYFSNLHFKGCMCKVKINFEKSILFCQSNIHCKYCLIYLLGQFHVSFDEYHP